MTTACRFEGCENKVSRMELCNGHYLQDWRGQALRPLRKTAATGRRPRSMPLRDWIVENSKIQGDGCTVWQGAKHGGGYGLVTFGGKCLRVHRIWYEIETGENLDGLVINHLCGNPACHTLDHLEAVTQASNSSYLTKLDARNKSGYRGVSRRGDGWVGSVQHCGRFYRSGNHSSPESANDWVTAKRAELGIKEFNEWREENLVEVSQ